MPGPGAAVRVIPPRIARLLDAVYREPDPYDTVEAFQRAYHGDLPTLTLDQVDAERILARIRWAVLIHRRDIPSPWLRERLARLDGAAAARRRPQPRR
jgi:hypothetical protein